MNDMLFPEGLIQKVKPAPHVAHNSGNNEWYTPAEYVDAARAVMGAIDLDPASCAAANEVVKAAAYFTAKDNGLAKDWRGRVWLNPPYAGDLVSRFVSKLCRHYYAGEVTQAVCLTNNATETQWWQSLSRAASGLCILRGRVRFWRPDGLSSSPLQGQTVIYLGAAVDRFAGEFSRFGVILFSEPDAPSLPLFTQQQW